jgi:hypothetical protein
MSPKSPIADAIRDAIDSSRPLRPDDKGFAERAFSLPRFAFCDIEDPRSTETVRSPRKREPVDEADKTDMSVFLVPVYQGNLLIVVTREGSRLIDVRTEFVRQPREDLHALSRRRLSMRSRNVAHAV